MPKIKLPKLIRRRPIIALGGALAALAATVVLAAWLVISTITITPNTVTTGTVLTAGITATNNDCATAVTANVWPALTGAGPGDSSSGALCLKNSSSPAIAEHYAFTSSNSNAVLGAGVKARVTSAGTATTLAAAAALTCTFPNMNPDGTAAGAQTELYFGPLFGLAMGDIAAGQQAGDRTLGTSAPWEKTCWTVLIPTAASPTLAGQTDTVGLTISASP